MATKKSASRRPPRKAAASMVPMVVTETPKTYLERNAKLAVTLGGAITALGIIFNFALPILNSHLPSASQSDLTALGSRLIGQLNSLDIRQSQSIERGQTLSDKLTSQQIRYLNDRIKTLRAELSRLDGARDGASITLRAADETELAADETDLKKAAAGQ